MNLFRSQNTHTTSKLLISIMKADTGLDLLLTGPVWYFVLFFSKMVK